MMSFIVWTSWFLQRAQPAAGNPHAAQREHNAGMMLGVNAHIFLLPDRLSVIRRVSDDDPPASSSSSSSSPWDAAAASSSSSALRSTVLITHRAKPPHPYPLFVALSISLLSLSLLTMHAGNVRGVVDSLWFIIARSSLAKTEIEGASLNKEKLNKICSTKKKRKTFLIINLRLHFVFCYCFNPLQYSYI